MHHELVCVEAEVEVAPKAEIVGKVQSCLVGSPTLESCPDCMPEDTFVISQLICIKIPLSFSAKASVQSTGILCNDPDHDDCDSDPQDCVKGAVRHRYEQSSSSDEPRRTFQRNYDATYHNNPE